jgi:hypothetical protein
VNQRSILRRILSIHKNPARIFAAKRVPGLQSQLRLELTELLLRSNPFCHATTGTVRLIPLGFSKNTTKIK